MHNETYSPVDIIRAFKISSASKLATVSILDQCTSTNDYLLSRKPPLKAKFNLCVARAQSAGRGQRGRTWHSYHNGIYLSISWQTTTTPMNEAWSLLMTAVRLAEMLEALGISGVGIKWPNDLYYKNAKLAGMLIERRGNTAVMGIGLNVATPYDTRNTDKTDYIGLDRTNINVPAYPDLLSLVVDVALKVREFIAFDESKQRFSQFDLMYNRAIEISRGGERISVIAKGIDRKAHLLVVNKGRIEDYGCEEISIHYDGIIDRCRQ